MAEDRHSRHMDFEKLEAEARDLRIADYQVALWRAIHFWAAGLNPKALKKLQASLPPIPSQAESAALVGRVVDRALERAHRPTI